jgi:hypothetical protein
MALYMPLQFHVFSRNPAFCHQSAQDVRAVNLSIFTVRAWQSLGLYCCVSPAVTLGATPGRGDSELRRKNVS